MIKNLDPKTRIKLKFHFPALSSALCLQRKVWYGWKTVSWTYPSVNEDASSERILSFLKWKEKKYSYKYEENIGKNIMRTKFK